MEVCDDFGNGSEMKWNGQVPKSGKFVTDDRERFSHVYYFRYNLNIMKVVASLQKT